MKKTLKTIINIALGFGTLLVFNESDYFAWNLLGIACFALLSWSTATRRLSREYKNDTHSPQYRIYW